MPITWITADDLEDSANPNAEEAAQAASWILYKLSAEKYPGILTTTEWYGVEGYSCNSCLDIGSYDTSIGGALLHQRHFYLPSYAYRSTNGVYLKHKPIISVQSVSINGEDIPSSSYRVANRAVLVKSDKQCWNLIDGITVSYTYGMRPPAAGVLAARILGNELLASVSGTACSLPERVKSVSRQGMDYDLIDPQDFLDQGRTGIYEIDLFLSTSNPSKAKKPARVFSAHRPKGIKYL